jgi:hypothetical protein
MYLRNYLGCSNQLIDTRLTAIHLDGPFPACGCQYSPDLFRFYLDSSKCMKSKSPMCSTSFQVTRARVLASACRRCSFVLQEIPR